MVRDQAAVLTDENVLKVTDIVNKLINKKGRILLRPSGTEPVIRVMVESESQEKCQKYVDMIVSAIAERGYCIE